MERKNVYIVGMYDRSITGFATYKEELSACMLTQPDLSVNITNLRCPIPEFRADEKCGIIIYDCPAIKQNPLEVSVALLNLHINNNNNNVFLINFAPSAPIVKILREYFNQGKIVYVIHDFMWTTYLWADLGTCRILLYVGRASEQKGIIDLLECFKVVLKVFPDCKLALMGEIDSKVIGAMDDKIRPNVLLLGEQPKIRVYEWYRIADIGILPSYYEQCSYTGIEMKIFGLPVISSDSFGLRQVLAPLISPVDRTTKTDLFRQVLEGKKNNVNNLEIY